MKSRSSIILIAITIALFQSSCVSKKQLTYLRYTDKSSDDQGLSVTPASYKIMPYDNLFIRIVTPDPQWSALFNIETGQAGITEESAALSGYIVDLNGYIDIPFVGKVAVGGKTIPEIKTVLDSVFIHYVTDASISVRLVNNYVSILGEVSTPGRYRLSKERITIFDALALASDMSVYGNRQKLQLIRPSSYGPLVKEFSLNDRSILSSEFYYVMPNDIIYIMPMRGRSFVTNSSVLTLFFSVITTTFGVIAFFRTL